ncbi:MAG: dockerin type I domain-containing protein [Planctomycetota bacterium]
MHRSCLLPLAVAVAGVSSPAFGVSQLLTNPGFEDLDAVDGPGDSWGAFGAASFDAFFGAGNAHASLFPDTIGNSGGWFQAGIAGTGGTTYQFDLLNTRVEANYDADVQFGLEFYAADDTTLLGSSLTPLIDTGAEVNGATYSHSATAPVGTAFVRPIAIYNNTFSTGPQRNVFVFDAYLSEVPAPGGNLLKNSSFDDEDGNGFLGDAWGNFGNTGFDDIFTTAPDGHASLFADFGTNTGAIWQPSVLAAEGDELQFDILDMRIESNFDALLEFGIEFYGADNATLISSSFTEIDETTLVNVDGNAFVTTAVAPAGTVYARPVVQFSNVNPLFLGTADANAFIFDTSFALVAPTALPGDANGDGVVDLLDFDVLAQNFGSNTGNGAADGDFNGDGTVDLLDFDILAQNFGATSPAAVPEPASLGLLGLGAAALVRGRRRRRA